MTLKEQLSKLAVEMNSSGQLEEFHQKNKNYELYNYYKEKRIRLTSEYRKIKEGYDYQNLVRLSSIDPIL